MDQIVTPSAHQKNTCSALKKDSQYNQTAGYEPGSMCFCRQCNTSAPHQKGTPCEDIRCPHCGAPMTRKF